MLTAASNRGVFLLFFWDNEETLLDFRTIYKLMTLKFPVQGSNQHPVEEQFFQVLPKYLHDVHGNVTSWCHICVLQTTVKDYLILPLCAVHTL